MPATLAELLTRSQTQSRDDGGQFITPENITTWLNEAYTDLGARLRLFEEEVSTTTDGGNTLGFPTDETLNEIMSITIGEDDRAVQVDSETWERWVDSETFPVPSVYRVFEGQIEVFPTPDTGTTVTLRFKKIPPPMVEADDTHLLPMQLERKLVEYSNAQSRFKDGDFEAGNNWLLLYEQGLPPVSRGQERTWEGPHTIPVMAAYWDIEDWDST